MRSAAPERTSCSAAFDGAELVIRNAHIEQRWRLLDGLLYATSLRDLKSNRQWLLTPFESPADQPDKARASRKLVFSKTWDESNPVARPSFVVELATEESPRSDYRFRTFEDAAAISVQALDAAPADPPAKSEPLEQLALASQHLKLTQVNLYDQTDTHNELVNERQWLLHTSENLRLQGNLFTLEDSLTGNGPIFLKEAPLPHARPEKTDSDLLYDAAHRGSRSPIPA